MKKFLQFLPNALIISVIAALVQILDQVVVGAGGIGPLIFGGAWIAYQAWAVYFLAGSTLKGGIRVGIGYVVSVVAVIAIFEVAKLIGVTGFWAVPLTLVVLVAPIVYLEKAHELFSLVPAVFVGAGLFIGMMGYLPNLPSAFAEGTNTWVMYGLAGLGELTYCAIGLFAGWLSITLQGLVPSNKAKVAEVETQ